MSSLIISLLIIFRCIAVDMRGYGDSEKPEKVEDYKIELLIEDIRDLVRQLGNDTHTSLNAHIPHTLFCTV